MITATPTSGLLVILFLSYLIVIFLTVAWKSEPVEKHDRSPSVMPESKEAKAVSIFPENIPQITTQGSATDNDKRCLQRLIEDRSNPYQ
jgi:hypothetical protein